MSDVLHPGGNFGRELAQIGLGHAVNLHALLDLDHAALNSQRPLSLEMPVGEEEDSYLGDFIEDEDADAPGEAAGQQLLREVIDEIFQSLTPREVRILQLRFGLVDGYCYTLEEVGKKFGVTRERIRQIEAQALSRLRHPSRSRKLRDYL